jgi:hypothetical protein
MGITPGRLDLHRLTVLGSSDRLTQTKGSTHHPVYLASNDCLPQNHCSHVCSPRSEDECIMSNNDSVRGLAQSPNHRTSPHPSLLPYSIPNPKVRTTQPSSSPRGSSQVPRARTSPHGQMSPRSSIYIDPLILPIESQIHEHILPTPCPYSFRLSITRSLLFVLGVYPRYVQDPTVT